jgi:hypothetical protein
MGFSDQILHIICYIYDYHNLVEEDPLPNLFAAHVADGERCCAGGTQLMTAPEGHVVGSLHAN